MKKIQELQLLINKTLKKPLMLGTLLTFVLPPIGILILAIIGISYLIKKIRLKQPFPTGIVTLFFITIIINSIVSSFIHHLNGYIETPILLISYFGLYLYIYDHLVRQDISAYKWIVISGGVYIFLFDKLHHALSAIGINLGVINYITGSALLGYPLKNNRLYGSTYNPNYAAFLLLLSLAFLLAYLLYYFRKKLYNHILFTLPILLVLMVGVYDTGSREGFITMLLMFGVFLFRLNWKVIPLIATIILLNVQNLLKFIPRHNMIDLSLQGRLKIWGYSIKLFLQNPEVGVTETGFSTSYYNLSGDNVAHAHNIFLSVFAEYGLLGGVLFVAVTAVTGFKLTQFIFQSKKFRMNDWFVLSLPIILLTGILDDPLSSPQIMFPTLILLGVFQRYTAHIHSLSYLLIHKPYKKERRRSLLHW